MQQNHSLPSVNVEKDAGNSMSGQLSTNLMQTFSHRTTGWHSDWPSKFNGLDI